jgi:hypothetical protein
MRRNQRRFANEPLPYLSPGLIDRPSANRVNFRDLWRTQSHEQTITLCLYVGYSFQNTLEKACTVFWLGRESWY